MRSRSFASILLVAAIFVSSALCAIYTANNVAPGELPPPLSGQTTRANLIVVGGGGSGGIIASLLSKSKCVDILVLDDGSEISFDDLSIGVVPGTEERSGYYRPGLEKSWLIQPNAAVNGFKMHSYGALARDVQGGDMRLSHYAVELGSSEMHRVEMYEKLGRPEEWSPSYVWNNLTDALFKFSGSTLGQNHANLGRIRAQESRDSSWQRSWIESCAARTGNRIEYDLNTINGSIKTCGAEPSNVRTDGTRSIIENEYLVPEALDESNRLTLVRNCKVTKVLFESVGSSDPVAVGVEGTFRNRHFSIRFSYGPNIVAPPNGCPLAARDYHKIVLSTGTIPTPQLLMLSGVGPAAHLAEHGIKLVKDIPAVGKHFKEGSVTYLEYGTNGTAFDIYGGDHPYNPDRVTSRPAAFVGEGLEEMFILWTPSNWGTNEFPYVVGYCLPFEMNQELEGSVTLVSSSIADLPRVDYGWKASTLAKHVRAFRTCRDIILNGSVSARFQAYERFPGLLSTSDADLASAASSGIQAILHASGTARMTATGNTTDGVVDLNFDVLGVANLKVASMAVFPYFTAAGGQTWSAFVGFNAQNKIRAELGLPKL